MKKANNKKEKYIYIFPELFELETNETINEFGLKDTYRKRINSIEELAENKTTIILSEPGNGKSRLLKQIVLKSTDLSYNSLFLDLKKLGNEDIALAIINKLNKYKPDIPKTNKEINDKKDFLFTEKFELTKSPKIIICLDALDEVRTEYLLDVIENIKKFRVNYENIILIVSCRKSIYKKVESSLKELRPKLIEVGYFSYHNTVEYLEKSKFTKKQIEEIFEHFNWSFNTDSLISNPRTLEIFISIKDKEGIENALSKNKAELLDAFIYGSLLEEDDKKMSNRRDIIKRVLETLALTMQIYQTTDISKDELMTFFNDIKSNLSLTFLQQITFEEFSDRALLLPSGEDKIQFQNKEFQEYLAAKEIRRLGRVDQVTFDLIYNGQLKEIYPSWENTLKYILLLNPTIQQQILQFIIREKSDYNLRIIEHILISDKNIISAFSTEEKTETFKDITDVINIRKIYIGSSFAQKLILYLNSHIDLKTLLDTNEIFADNIILITKHLHKSNELIDLEFWKNRYIHFIKNKNSSESIRNSAISALQEFCDISLIKDNIEYKEETGGIKNQIIKSCVKIAPNDFYTIDLIIQSITHKDLGYINNYDFDKVTEKGSILYVLIKMSENKDLLRHYHHGKYENYLKEIFLKNIEDVYNDKIEETIFNIITISEHYFLENDFIFDLIKLIKSKNINIIFKIINYIKKNDVYPKHSYNYDIVFQHLITPQNAKRFIKEMLKIDSVEPHLVYLFETYQFKEDADGKKIYEIGYESFKDKMLARQKASLELQKKSIKSKADRELRIYKDFQFKLEPEKGTNIFYDDVFNYYRHHKETIEKYIQPKEKNRLVDLINNIVINYDFNKANIKITKRTNSSTEYSSSRMILIFANASYLFKELKIPAKSYRNKIIEYLPFAFDYLNNNSKNIFDLIPNLKSKEIEKIINFYEKERSDDTIVSNINNLFNVIDHFKIIEALPIIKKIIFDERFEAYKRTSALDLINKLKVDYHFYNEVFNYYKNLRTEKNEQILIRANTLLIESENTFKDNAVKWRMDEIIQNPILFKPSGDREGFIDPHEIDFRVAHFQKPISSLGDDKYIDLYLALMDNSIIIYKKDDGYRSYAAYMWGIVFNYFQNLKKYKSINLILKLEKQIAKYSNENLYNDLYRQYTQVRLDYLKELGKPDSYAECIKKYNELKSKQYSKVFSANDLAYLIEDIISTDLKNWVENEGAYKIPKMNNRKGKLEFEALIQKTIKTQFENALLRRGIREYETRIYREPQMLSDERPDFIISYGFTGQVVVELKLANNEQAHKKKLAEEYKKKMLKYVDGNRCDFGIMVVFQTDEKIKWESIKQMLFEIYKNDRKLKVFGLNCLN